MTQKFHVWIFIKEFQSTHSKKTENLNEPKNGSWLWWACCSIVTKVMKHRKSQEVAAMLGGRGNLQIPNYYLSHFTSLNYSAFETYLMRNEFERLVVGQPLELLGIK